MDVLTTDTYSPCQNKVEIVIIIIKIKPKRKRFKRNIPKRICYFGIVWEAEIYYCTAGKDGHPDL